jgi:hypothetical protein
MDITIMGNTAVCPACSKTVRITSAGKISHHNAAPKQRCRMSGRSARPA